MSDILPDYGNEKPGIVSALGVVDPATRRDIQRSLSKRVHGVFASRKNRKPLPWRNRHEHGLFGLLEIDPAVRSFEAMPEKVSFLLNGVPAFHVPSVRVVTATGVAILDVAQSRGRLAETISAVYAARGIAYRAIDTCRLHVLPRRSNADWILSHRGYEPTPAASMQVTKALSRVDVQTVAELGRSLDVPEPHATICAMALDGQLSLDLTAPSPLDMRAALFGGAGR